MNNQLLIEIVKHLAGRHNQKKHGTSSLKQLKVYSGATLYQGSTTEVLNTIRQHGILSRDQQLKLLGQTAVGAGYGSRDNMDIVEEYNPDEFVHVTTSTVGASQWASNALANQTKPGAKAIIFEIKVDKNTVLYEDPASGDGLIKDRIPPEQIIGYREVAESRVPDTYNKFDYKVGSMLSLKSSTVSRYAVVLAIE